MRGQCTCLHQGSLCYFCIDGALRRHAEKMLVPSRAPPDSSGFFLAVLLVSLVRQVPLSFCVCLRHVLPRVKANEHLLCGSHAKERSGTGSAGSSWGLGQLLLLCPERASNPREPFLHTEISHPLGHRQDMERKEMLSHTSKIKQREASTCLISLRALDRKLTICISWVPGKPEFAIMATEGGDRCPSRAGRVQAETVPQEG